MEIKYSKKDIIKKLTEAATLYNKNLLDKNIMFIFENNDSSLSFVETIHKDFHLQHLTGIGYKKSASDFFKDSLNNTLSPKDIYIKKDKITFAGLKLDVLISAMSINKVAKRIGDYNYSKPQVVVQKVVGNVSLCLGYSDTSRTGKQLKYFYPKSLLKDKINYNTENPNKIVAILSKNDNKSLYDEITYFSNDMRFSRLFNDEEIGSMIDYENIFSTNKKYQEQIDNFFDDFEKLSEYNRGQLQNDGEDI